MSYIAIQSTDEGGEEVLGVAHSLKLLHKQVIEEITALYIEESTTEEDKDKICALMDEGIYGKLAVHTVLGPDFATRVRMFTRKILASVKFERA